MEAFKSEVVLPGILRRLLLQDVVRHYSREEVQARNISLYRASIPATSFTLVLEGHLEVEVGRDGLKFEAGPFYHFGVQALELADSGGGDYIPDFTVRPISDCLLLVVSCKQYLDARKATRFQRTHDQESSPSLNHSPQLPPRLEMSVSSPGRLTNGRRSKSDTHLRSVAKRLHLGGGRPSDGEETHRLLPDVVSEEEEEGEQVALTADEGPTVPVTAEVEMRAVGGGGPSVNDSSNEPPPTDQDTPHTLDSSRL